MKIQLKWTRSSKELYYYNVWEEVYMFKLKIYVHTIHFKSIGVTHGEFSVDIKFQCHARLWYNQMKQKKKWFIWIIPWKTALNNLIKQHSSKSYNNTIVTNLSKLKLKKNTKQM